MTGKTGKRHSFCFLLPFRLLSDQFNLDAVSLFDTSSQKYLKYAVGTPQKLKKNKNASSRPRFVERRLLFLRSLGI